MLNKYLGNTVGESQMDVDRLSNGCLKDVGTSIGCKIISDSDDFEFPRNQTAIDNFLHIRKEQHMQACSQTVNGVGSRQSLPLQQVYHILGMDMKTFFTAAH